MRIYSFATEGVFRLGAEVKGQLIDLAAAYALLVNRRGLPEAGAASLPGDLLQFLRLGEPGRSAARAAIEFMARRPPVPVGQRVTFALEEVTILAPMTHPGKIVGVDPRPPGTGGRPRLFIKVSSTIVGPGEAILCPATVSQLRVETCLALVLGRRARKVSPPEALGLVAGYSLLQDISAPDPSLTEHDAIVARNFDTFSPFGPCLVTADEFPDPGCLRARTLINGKVQQEASIGAAFDLAQTLSAVTEVMTLEPGDVLAIGFGSSPPAAGGRGKPTWLRQGDTLCVQLEGVGELINTIAGGR